jgi:hypothetical protein
MSHDTHQQTAPKGPKTPIGAAFWLVLVIVFLFIGSVNFVNVMSHDEGHEGAKHEAVEAGHEATHEEHATEAAAPAEHATDSAAHTEAH